MCDKLAHTDDACNQAKQLYLTGYFQTALALWVTLTDVAMRCFTKKQMSFKINECRNQFSKLNSFFMKTARSLEDFRKTP